MVDLANLESKVESLQKHNKQLTAENTELKAEVFNIKSEILELKTQHHRFKKTQVEIERGISIEQQEINSNVIIRGVDIEENANKDQLIATFNQIRSHLGVAKIDDFEAVDIGVLHTKGNKNKEQTFLPKTIQVKFKFIDHKRRFLQIRRTKKSFIPSDIGLKQNSKKPILIVEQLTKQNQELLYNARSLRSSSNFKFVWSNNGQILARQQQGSKVIRIEDINHVNRLKAHYSSARTTDGQFHTTSNLSSNSSDTQA